MTDNADLSGTRLTVRAWEQTFTHEQTAIEIPDDGLRNRPIVSLCGALPPVDLKNDAGRLIKYPTPPCNRPKGHDGRHAISSLRHAREWEWIDHDG